MAAQGAEDGPDIRGDGLANLLPFLEVSVVAKRLPKVVESARWSDDLDLKLDLDGDGCKTGELCDIFALAASIFRSTDSLGADVLRAIHGGRTHSEACDGGADLPELVALM